MPMNTNQARVTDPILSQIALGYTNSEFIGHELFPVVPIKTRGAKVLKFGKQSFRKINAQRAPGTNKKRITVGFETDPVVMTQDALEGIVPIENAQEAATIPKINLGQEAVLDVMDILLLNREIDCATIAQKTANYANNNKMTLAGAAKWSDPNSSPEKDIADAREAVRTSIGRYPNKLTLSADTYAALCFHPKIVERFKYTSGDSVTEKMLARLFKVEKVVVGKAIYLPEDAADDATSIDIWSKSAILAFVPTSVRSRRSPSFGYNYTLIGHPDVKKPYFENSADCWVYPVTHECGPQLTSSEAGFLIDQAV